MAQVLFKASEEQKALWVVTAEGEGLTLSAWIRRTLNAALTEGAAEPAERPFPKGRIGSSVAPSASAERPFRPDFKKPKAEAKGRRR